MKNGQSFFLLRIGIFNNLLVDMLNTTALSEVKSGLSSKVINRTIFKPSRNLGLLICVNPGAFLICKYVNMCIYLFY